MLVGRRERLERHAQRAAELEHAAQLRGNIDLWEVGAGVQDVQSGKRLRELVGHSRQVKALCFSGDGRVLLSTASDNEILIYSIGLDGKDDGASNPPGNSREPDIVVRISSSKARQ